MKLHTDNLNKSGFTMAEVLITIAVIGVVAAVTIPTLVQSYKKRVVETRLAKFYSAINQAIRLSEIENGEITKWKKMGSNNSSMPPQAWYEEYLKQFLSVSKIEVNVDNDVWGSTILYFPDGSAVKFSVNSWYFFPIAHDGLHNSKKDVGKKLFTFVLDYNKGIEPYNANWDGTIEMLKNDSSLGCRADATNEAAYCTKLIQMNNWKIPDDYPFKF